MRERTIGVDYGIDCGLAAISSNVGKTAAKGRLERVPDEGDMEPAHWITQTRQLANLKRRAEREMHRDGEPADARAVQPAFT